MKSPQKISLNLEGSRKSSHGGNSGTKRKKKKFISEAKNHGSDLYRQAAYEFQNQNRGQKVQTVISCILCSYWILNSTLGFYLIFQYPHLQETHPQIYMYLMVFSSKWITAVFATLFLMLASCCILRVCCGALDVCQNSIGAFPVVYIFVIIMSYMYSLYYGVIMIKEIYAPSANEDQDYKILEETESTLLKLFVFNEVLVGAYIILIFLYSLFCEGLRKSEHLIAIEGESYGIDEKEIQRYRQELQESRVRTESMRKELSVVIRESNAPNIQFAKEEMLKEIQQEQVSIRNRSISHDPYKQIELRSLSVNSQGAHTVSIRKTMSPDTNKSLKISGIHSGQGHIKQYSLDGSLRYPIADVKKFESNEASGFGYNNLSTSNQYQVNAQDMTTGAGASLNHHQLAQNENSTNHAQQNIAQVSPQKTNDHSFEKYQLQSVNQQFSQNQIMEQQQQEERELQNENSQNHVQE